MCDSPFYKKPKGYLNYLELPCGKCPVCKRRRVNQWVFRLQEENKVSSSAYFITLTYDTKHVPITNKGFMTLFKKDYQDFMRRIRGYQKGTKIKYYACGEYGSATMRPHYHAIIFNVQDVEYIRKAWTKGITDIGTVTDASIAYTCKYIDKPHVIPVHRNDDRIKEFSLMSQGLGKSYIEDSDNVKWHKDDLRRNYVVKKGGIKVAMPRYYRKKIFDDYELKIQRANAQNEQRKKDKQIEKDCIKRYGDKMDVVNYKYQQKIGRLNRYNNSLKKQRDETKISHKRAKRF